MLHVFDLPKGILIVTFSENLVGQSDYFRGSLQNLSQFATVIESKLSVGNIKSTLS